MLTPEARAALTAWLATGGAGNDIIIGSAVKNTLKGGAGNDIVLGRSGNDVIDGGGGRDLLIGDAGSDNLKGVGGDDILVGASTLYDTGIPALQTILKEWVRTDVDYATRVAHLKNGGGLNGSTVLNASRIVDDAIADIMTGGLGTDWFCSLLPQDTLTDRTLDEIII